LVFQFNPIGIGLTVSVLPAWSRKRLESRHDHQRQQHNNIFSHLTESFKQYPQ
jgi:hypothetical protein